MLRFTVKNLVRIVAGLSVAAMPFVASACDGLGNNDAIALPPEDTFYLLSPEDDVDLGGGLVGQARQAVCADTEAYDRLEELVEVYNENIRPQVQAVKAALRAAARIDAADGSVEFSAERNGNTISLVALEAEDGSINYTVTLTNSEFADGLVLLDGSMAADQKSGSWNVHRRTGEVFADTDWSVDDNGVLTVTRVVDAAAGQRTSVYTRSETDASIVFTGPNHNATASWSRETKDGSVVIEGVQGSREICWDASDDLTEFCSIECPAS